MGNIVEGKFSMTDQGQAIFVQHSSLQPYSKNSRDMNSVSVQDFNSESFNPNDFHGNGNVRTEFNVYPNQINSTN